MDTNHPPLSEEQLAEIEGRAAAATAGPWEPWLETRGAIGGCSVILVQRDTSDVDNEMYLNHYIDNRQVASPNVQLDADLDFIANARQDVPHLVAEVRRLRALLRANGLPD
ncbi:hypothetical protein [Kitasatospora phosalacinea]|uniref:Uncharacterized protein n=1 Tax=Kitasatospora phosalacinea TaxID=2065 RepID=A0ABW6GN69_9ACTN